MYLTTDPWAMLASATPDPAFLGNFVLAVVVGGTLLNVMISAIGVWNASRRQPPLAEESYRVFVPKAEYLNAIERIHQRIDESNNQLARSTAMISKAFNDLERAIGRVEGKIKELQDKD